MPLLSARVTGHESSRTLAQVSPTHLKFLSPWLLRKTIYTMHSIAILHEVQQLDNVSDRLDTLTEQHPLVSGALVTISGSVRNTATLWEVLVARMSPLAGLDPATP